MAIKRFVMDGYGQIELNNVAFRRDGRIEAQCKPAVEALKEQNIDFIENGMLLAVDNINRVVKPAVDGSLPIAIVYSGEHMYDERANALKDFKLGLENDFLPRLGYTTLADKLTTNCVCYDDAEFENDEKFVEALENIAEVKLFGGACEAGAIKVSATEPAFGPKLLVVKKTTMPDGQLGIKFQQIV